MATQVTKDALVKRINRKLARDDAMLRAARGEHNKQQLGDFYTIDVARNFLIEANVDIAALGAELSVLHKGDIVI